MDDFVDEIETLYRTRYVGFRNALAAITGSREGARDAVQEAFARALNARRQYRGEAPLAAWVWRIAFRIALGLRSEPAGALDVSGELPVANNVLPELDADLAAALRRLSPRRRTVVFLRYFADFSYPEISAALGISEGTVGATLAHAHRELRGALTNQGAAAVHQGGRE
jgi:RNA polymerase sigma-70 factor, ECF subfamily